MAAFPFSGLGASAKTLGVAAYVKYFRVNVILLTVLVSGHRLASRDESERNH
jgi:hypothetical protein